MLAAISIIDWRSQRIPDRLSLPLIAAGLAWSFWFGEKAPSAYAIGAGVGYASLAGFGWLYFRLRGHEGLGLGDAKLFAAGGAWLGWQALPPILLVASIGGILYAVAGALGKASPARRIAFGPWLSLAIWLIWVARLLG